MAVVVLSASSLVIVAAELWRRRAEARLEAPLTGDTLGGVILENGTIRTLDPSLPTRRVALDRRRADRRRRRRARDRAAEPETSSISAAAASSPASPTRTSTSPPGRSRGTTSACTAARSLDEALDRVRGAPRTGTLAARPGLARRRLARRPADAAGARRGRAGAPGGADLEGLPLALAQLRGARARRRRPRGRGRRRRARRGRRADRRPARGVGVAVQGRASSASPDDEYVDAMRDGRAGSRPRAASRPCTTRTAGSARSASGSGSSSRAPCRCASGSRCRPSALADAPRARPRAAAPARRSCGSAT